MSDVSIIPLGGMGKVTQNMYLYVSGDEILIIDCGIGFPDIQMYGADILIPDTTYLHSLLDEGKKIVGMILTHGHDDHIGATPYILSELPEFPIYASPLTAGFAENRMSASPVYRAITVIRDKEWFKIGTAFEALPVAATHSVPDTKHFFIRTPAGTIYHGTDFKLDKDPVDGIFTDEEAIASYSQSEHVLCMLMDCLRVEKSDWVPSESMAGPALDAAILSTKGKAIVTLMSSHIHRIQQTIYAAQKAGRKIAFVGRSVEQNVEVAVRLKKLHIPEGMQIDKRDINSFPHSEICIVIAGSQGQEGSSLVRAVFGEHPTLQITAQDKVVFSADAIPGNEIPYYSAIDELCRNGVDVIYPAIEPTIHQSGHGSAPEQRHLLDLVKPQYVMPIGGADRHRVKFTQFVAAPLHFELNNVLLPAHGEIVHFADGKVDMNDSVQISPRIVDGLGIGDVGPQVLSDRKALSEAGIIVVLIPRVKGKFDFRDIQIISRGFVFMKEADEVIAFIKEETTAAIKSLPNKVKDGEIKRKVERTLAKKLYKVIKREPMIVIDII
jgi:ribonuclease J